MTSGQAESAAKSSSIGTDAIQESEAHDPVNQLMRGDTLTKRQQQSVLVMGLK